MDHDKPNEAIPCANGCGFFGRASTGGMCSKCFKEQNKNEKTESSSTAAAAVNKISSSTPILSTPSSSSISTVSTSTSEDGGQDAKKVKSQVDKTRCAECKKKLALTGIECKCGNFYCSSHRIAEKHSCSFDFKAYGRSNIEKSNEKVVAQSLEKL